MFDEIIEIEKTDKVAVLVIPYVGDRLAHVGSAGYKEHDVLLFVPAHKELEWSHDSELEELSLEAYKEYDVLYVGIERHEIYVTVVNWENV